MPSTPVPVALEFDHIGLIVKELTTGRLFLQQALGLTCWTARIDDPGIKVCVQFGSAPGSPLVYELVAPLGADSPIAGALRNGKSILNHMAYRTPDLRQSAAHLRGMGCFPAGDPQPAVAYSGALIQFWVSPLRFLIELIEKPGYEHRFSGTGDRAPSETGGIGPDPVLPEGPGPALERSKR